MKFSEIIINMIAQKGDDSTKMETARNKMLMVITELFSEEQNSDDGMSQGEDTDNQKAGNSRARSRTRNPNKARRRWQSRD